MLAGLSLKKWLSLMALGMTGGSIYMIVYIKYVFYDQQIAAMGMNNTQSGLLLTVYAILAIVLLMPGGGVADKCSPKKVLCLSLLGTTALTLVYAFTMDFYIAMAVWVGFAFSSAFAFSPSLMKTIGNLGKQEEQGKLYGIYYSLNGCAGLLINVVALYVCSRFENPADGFFWACIVSAGGTSLGLLMMIFMFRDDAQEVVVAAEDKFKWKDFGKVFKMPVTWIFGITQCVAYTIYSSNTYFNPYLIDVVGITPTDSGVFTIMRTYVFMLIGAPIGGFICDRLLKSTAKWFIISLSLTVAMFIITMLLPSTINPTLASVWTLFPAFLAMALYGVQFSLIRELNVSPAIVGTMIGICALLSWTPDMYMHSLFGHWLDTYGNDGYNYIFGYLIGMCVLGIVAAAIVRKRAVAGGNRVAAA